MSLPVMIWFILQKTNESLQVCLDGFFDAHDRKAPTKSAFTQARANLDPMVFKRLNRVVTSLFYKNGNFKTWNGFRVLAVDGASLQLPGDHWSLGKKFSRHFWGPKADAPHWMSRVSYLYDVFNGMVLDAQMGSFRDAERTLCKRHVPWIKAGDLLLFDRGYASYELMALLESMGAHFILRVSDSWTPWIREFLDSGKDQQVVEMPLPARPRTLLEQFPHLGPSPQKVRLIKRTGHKGELQVFCTSLNDTELYGRSAVMDLYGKRWEIEEAYKLIKARLEVADFSGMTSWAIEQDFYAKTMLISLCNCLCKDLEPKALTRCRADRKKTERVRIINRTYGLSRLKSLIRKTAYHLGNIRKWLLQFQERLASSPEYSRRNQSYPRLIKKKVKYPMAYKAV